MADSRSYSSKASSTTVTPPHKSLSFTRIICKSIFFLLFLIAIPLFPSQAPGFMNQSLLSKFWELLHLLFIGVAVCYGLFSSRNVEGDFDTTHYSTSTTSGNGSVFDDLQSSNNYVSRIFHVSPIFEDGYENLTVSDDKNVDYSHYYSGESNVDVGVTDAGIDEHRNNGSVNYENGNEISPEHDENSGVQAWNSQYVQGESVVVLSQLNYELDEWGKPSQVTGHKPLGLPVRSLKSLVRNPASPNFSDGSEPGSSFIGVSGSSGNSLNEKNFGDMDPVNLEEKFNENFALHSHVPSRSRSARVEVNDKIGHVGSHPSHFRPLSVDETQFESLQSHSFRSTTSFSSHASSMSNSPTMLSPSHSTSSDSPRSRIEELGKSKDFFASYPPASQSPQTTKTRDAPLNAFHLRRYSSGSLFPKNSRKQLKDESKDLGGKRRVGLPSNKESVQSSLDSDKKSATATMVKASSRGKSVRTVRRGVLTAEAAKAGEMSKTPIDDWAGKGYNGSKAVDIGETEMKEEVLGNKPNGISKKNLETQYDVPKPTFAKYQTIEKEEPLETVSMKSEKDLENETGVSSNKDMVTDYVSDAGQDPYEVDRKAGEFIAKFKEQIRLQKVASVERSKGMRLSGKHLR